MLADQTFFVEIMAPYASNAHQEAYIAHNGFPNLQGVASNAIKMNLQPAGAQMTILVEGEIGKVFTGYTTASGVVEGMRLTLSGTNQQYIVKGRANYNIGIPHSELTLIKRDP